MLAAYCICMLIGACVIAYFGKKEGKEKKSYIQKETNDTRRKDSESTHQDWSPKRRIQNEKNTIPQSRGKADFTLVQSVKSC